MTAQGVGAGEPAAAAPVAACAELAAADEFLLAAVEAFVPFAVVLAREGLAADGADEGPFVSVRAEVGAEVVSTCEPFGAQVALEGCGVFLHTLLRTGSWWSARIGEFEDIVTIGDRGGGGAAGFGGR